MELGTVLPTLELGPDPGPLREYAQGVEAAGYDHILASDHVLGVDPDRDWEGPYDNDDLFHEPLTTLSHLAAVTDDLAFGTAILILPQRQTALVAKQAAQVARFCDGGFRLGVAVGWNPLEYVALGEEFDDRGPRMTEQLDVLRRLWTEEVVEFEGRFHDLPGVGINPRPDEPVPLWLGGTADPVKRRIAEKGDGWVPQFDPAEDREEAEAELADLYEYVEDADRDPADVGLQGRMSVPPGEPDEWVRRAEAWQAVGADYLAVTTQEQGLDGVGEHVDLLETVAGTLAEVGLLER
ncbi:LLM class F420-dependent oxidoreductase [Salinirussus salinus]|uniref:LLM class F420-dependent oxidoreductase n=1 Tax=Salinirussus salinus TaxID=1198300 RepID=UPI00135AFCFE|nr:LLM class F420-dependent oxidoreductase [Salinirussus salinus]